MKITFILAAIGKKPGEKYINSWKMEPLTIAVLKALTPKEIETNFFDDRIENIDYDTDTDFVAISAETYSARRAYEISKRFMEKGKKVIIGGYHATLNPDEVAEYADSILVGNAESIWTQIINDFKQDKLKKKYKGTTVFKDILPDRSIYADKKYMPLSLVETGRGCNFNCTFCSISAYYDSKYISKRIDKIVEEIKGLKNKTIFFVDDNIVADPNFAIELFKAITPLKIRWVGQGALTMARSPELLKWIKKSGGEAMLIGFESLEEKNLEQMSKEWSTKIGQQDDLIKRIHKAGIGIYATFVFGFDYDTEATVEKALNFAKKHNFFISAFNHLLPMPGTKLYSELYNSDKLKVKKWWLDDSTHYGDIVFEPKQISSEKLSLKCLDARKKYFTFSQILKRSYIMLFRKPKLLIYLYNFFVGWIMRKEVSEKYGLPIGRGLNESKR